MRNTSRVCSAWRGKWGGSFSALKDASYIFLKSDPGGEPWSGTTPTPRVRPRRRPWRSYSKFARGGRCFSFRCASSAASSSWRGACRRCSPRQVSDGCSTMHPRWNQRSHRSSADCNSKFASIHDRDQRSQQQTRGVFSGLIALSLKKE